MTAERCLICRSTNVDEWAICRSCSHIHYAPTEASVRLIKAVIKGERESMANRIRAVPHTPDEAFLVQTIACAIEEEE